MKLNFNRLDSYLKDVIKPMGLVFGDIGTSPIYTLSVILLLIHPSRENIIGIISLIIWTLIILVFVEYSWLAMSLGQRGEGGTIVLRELLLPFLKSQKMKYTCTILTFIGVSFIIGDGVITPAISILSAVEGINLIPHFSHIHLWVTVLLASVIALILFTFQKHGADKVARVFGPIMLIWFISLAVSGILSLVTYPGIIQALNPYFGLKFLFSQGLLGFLVLSAVFLCSTGGEALYADMGQIGREPIRKAWHLVFIALVLNYLGQGAYLLQHPKAKIVLFEMFSSQVGSMLIYIPFLFLSIMATVIASQALISGIFSIVYQGINTNLIPPLKIDYTSPTLRSQIYINSVNWFLCIFVILLIVIFKQSDKLGMAYGLAVSGTMTLTGIFLATIFYFKKQYVLCFLSIGIFIIDFIFFASNTLKLPSGGYWSIIIALIPFSILIIYNFGQLKLRYILDYTTFNEFLWEYKLKYQTSNKHKGTALFIVKDVHNLPPYVINTIIKNNIFYEENIILSIIKKTDPFGIEVNLSEEKAEGLRTYIINAGYLELLNVNDILTKSNITPNIIYYGSIDIESEHVMWKLFGFIRNVGESLVKFYMFPTAQTKQIVTKIDTQKAHN